MEKSVPEVEEAKVKLVEVTALMVRKLNLLLKVDQSLEVKSPLLEAEAEGRLKATWPVEVEIEKSFPVVEAAKVKLVEVAPLMVR